ncbi:hypothetical protein [Deinococcus sp. UYEF24]
MILVPAPSSWPQYLDGLKQKIILAGHPTETTWTHLKAQVPTSCQGEALAFHDSVDPVRSTFIHLVDGAPTFARQPAFWNLHLTRTLELRHSQAGETLIRVPIRAGDRLLGSFGLLFDELHPPLRNDIWAFKRFGVAFAEILLLNQDFPLPVGHA